MMFRKLFLILALPLVSLSAAYADSGQSYMKEGIVAFKEARYQDAIAYFTRAQKEGVNVSYNIGATYYKLDQFRRAKIAFLNASKTKGYQQFAWYNLGLVERKLGNDKQAIKWFKKASAMEGNKKVNALAKQMIEQLSPKEATTQSSPKDSRDSRDVQKPESKPSSSLEAKGDKFAALETGLGYQEYVADIALDRREKRRVVRRRAIAKRKASGGLSIAIGNDDDVISATNNSASGLGSSYFEASAYVDVPVGQHFTITGDVYNQRFPDVSNEDFNVFKLGVHYHAKFGGMRVTPSIYYSKSKFGGDDYQTINDFRIRTVKRLGKGKYFIFRARYSDIDADAAYNYTAGDRTQLRFEYKTRIALGKLRFRYQLENNDRANIPTRDYSPTRHDFRARLRQKVFGNKWWLSSEFQYRISNYDPTVSSGFEREDDRYRIRVDLSRRMNKKWKLGLLFVHTNNDSNNTSDDYTKNDVQFYSSWRF